MNLLQGDCLELMKDIPDGSVDMILADLPYGTTACKWDEIIPFEPLWEQYERVVKDNGAIVLTAVQPFTSALVMSNPKKFRHSWYWDKINGSNPMTAKIKPMPVVEDVLVFSKKRVNYMPIMVEAELKNMRSRGGEYKVKDGVLNGSKTFKSSKTHNESKRFPKNLLKYNNRTGELNNVNRVHPTQKPVELFEYLIKTYTNEGDTVLDNVMGSGTTGVACKNLNRNFIGMELDETYFNIAKERIEKHEVTE
ncbi:DNA-methyltransferase [Jeotgalibaca porci]|uniref:DNA-methyltransferase n=1 Tax=Jeotgalibaca porci TaxID=1868793 RepID=UPI0035A18F87